jgi:hypothetical protein
MSIPILRAAVACAVLAAGCGVAVAASQDGTGWTVTRLDLEVRVSQEEPAMSVGGTLRARLDAGRSFGPSFRVNANDSGIRWLSLEAPGAKKADLNDQGVGGTLAHVRFEEAFVTGDELEVSFELEMETGASQLMAREDIALASWIHAWYPNARQDGKRLTARTMSVPGTTTFHLPAGWIAISDGKLIRREVGEQEAVEVWELGANAVARSFAAGPFRAAERQIDNRQIRIYLLEEHPITADRLADLLMRTMAAQEARLGEFPFDGYGVVEVPNDIEGWGAASQQTFIMAKSNTFEFEHGNVPLWAHEMGHAWWGNTVGTRGPGSKMAGEALAQVGVLIALEALEGREAVVEFLEFSRSGYSSAQCARGYFGLVDDGRDHPLATLGSSSLTAGETHNLADSKGMWVYHMLWQRLGDELFFGTLRELIAEFAGRSMSLDDVRRAFVAAAPGQDLQAFFAQWLDRAGGIDVEATFTAGPGSVDLLLAQSAEEPFDFDLEVELKLADGSSRRERVEVRGRETRARFEVPGQLVDAELDPDRLLLMRRAAYGAMPEVEGIAQTAEWLRPETYIGDYQPVDSPHSIAVVDENGALWVRTREQSMRLWPVVDTPHRFRGTQGWVTFELEDGRATLTTYEVDGGMTLEAVRID